jgi:hypothetical protein
MGANDDNLQAFNFDITKFAKKLDLAVEVVTVRIVLDLFTRITKRTPVDTGRARASWDIKVGVSSDYLPEAGKYAGAKDVSGEVEKIDGKQIVFISTSIDYMKYLEEGSSQQAPAGIVLLSLAELEVELENILDQL